MICGQMNADGEPREALKAYDESTLVISGNSTTLARWDARLGPLLHDIPGKTGRGIIPSVASLRSLTPDGGLTMMIDIVVERLHPVGFIETLPDGTRLAPVNEAGNQAAEASWEVCLPHPLSGRIPHIMYSVEGLPVWRRKKRSSIMLSHISQVSRTKPNHCRKDVPHVQMVGLMCLSTLMNAHFSD